MRVAQELEGQLFDTLPDEAVTKIEKLRRADYEHFAEMRGRFELSQEAESRLRSAENVLRDLRFNKADEKRLKRQQRVVDDARKEVNELRAGKLAPFPTEEGVADWIARNLNKRFESCAVKIKRPADPQAALEDVRKRIADKIRKRHQVDNARLPSAQVKAQVIAAIENLAASGNPDFNPAFRYEFIGTSDTARAQGTVRWPETFLNEARSIGNGLAFAAWLCKDILIARAKEEIAKLARDDEALTLEQRRKKLAQIDAEILELERQEEALVEMTGAPRRRATNSRDRNPSMLAILGLREIRAE